MYSICPRNNPALVVAGLVSVNLKQWPAPGPIAGFTLFSLSGIPNADALLEAAK